MRFLPLFVIWCLWFLNFSTRTAFSPILPLIEESLSLSHGMSGALFTSLSIGYSLSLLAIGSFVSVWGHKRTVVIGFAGIGLTLIAFQWAESYLAFHLLFFLLGMATGSYLPSMLPIITTTYAPGLWGRVIGINETAAGLSIFSIPIVVAFGLNFFSWKHLLLILAFASLVLPIFSWKVLDEPDKEPVRKGSRYLDLFKRKILWVMVLFWILASGSGLGLYSILPLYLVKEKGFDLHLANTLFGVSRIGGIFVPIFIGLLVDRYGYRTMLRLTLSATGLITIALGLSPTLPLTLSSLVLQGILSISFFPVGLAAISNTTSLTERSMAVGMTISIGVMFGMGGAPLILGFIADHFSFRAGIIGLGILTALSSLGTVFLKESHRGNS